eukprot:CAMPEP_0206512910 /NCGR_PEP_ID=MMETSP0324_2-20121206/61200_1 /ASSEMBLY_ACC=CAM_ASM_000836 /TAXON_ID=2866 /ORGANISM="Crypthecodinium cohnii, Strain Seligo" /LENGTH=139 /DNA_ID=CAMNT_0054005037 /DNA_START=23 /DNA_END=442 /DNA_ORIENTATION=+
MTTAGASERDCYQREERNGRPSGPGTVRRFACLLACPAVCQVVELGAFRSSPVPPTSGKIKSLGSLLEVLSLAVGQRWQIVRAMLGGQESPMRAMTDAGKKAIIARQGSSKDSAIKQTSQQPREEHRRGQGQHGGKMCT